jgi:signal peptidase I
VLVAALGASGLSGCGGGSRAASTTGATAPGAQVASVAGAPANDPSASTNDPSTPIETAGKDAAKSGKGAAGGRDGTESSASKVNSGAADTAAVSATGTSAPSGGGSASKASSVSAHSRSRNLRQPPSDAHRKAVAGGPTAGTPTASGDGLTGTASQPSGANTSGDVAFQVPGGSMEPTYQPESTVYYDPTRTHPQIGEVIVFYLPVGGTDSSCATVMAEGAACASSKPGLTKTMVMKRVVGLEGDTIAIHEGKVVRNGQPESEPPTIPCGNEPGCEFPKPITVPAGEYYVLADNRGLVHEDSRIWGSLPQDAILGTVVGS